MNSAQTFDEPCSAIPKRKVRREKTFTGCWTCRSRKVKCDEGIPACQICLKRGYQCNGYQPIWIWVTNYHDYPPGRRRVLRSDLTWQGHRIYQPVEVDELIAQCNIERRTTSENFEKTAGPFTVFCLQAEVPQSISDVPNASDSDNHLIMELWHHYVTYTAVNMMPFKDKRNPWLSLYPHIACQRSSRGEKSLYCAILAQAAGNLAQLGSRRENMSRLATRFYTDGIRHLRTGLESMDFSAVLASMGTLIMVEIYAKISNAWRMHLNGAWNFLMTHQNDKPWEKSEEAWIIAQSLCLVKIRADTMQRPNLESTNDHEVVIFLLSEIAYRDDFGFTAGANKSLMKCIHDITSLESQLRVVEQHQFERYQSVIDELYHRIKRCQLTTPVTNMLIKLHHDIFKTGVLIHFLRRILNLSPSALIPYLESLFDAVEQYQDFKGGYITLWPVFIGAVEVFEERHKNRVRTWLDTADMMGAATRSDVRMVIEAVWKERGGQRDYLGEEVAIGDVRVDWREVMSKVGPDLLLV